MYVPGGGNRNRICRTWLRMNTYCLTPTADHQWVLTLTGKTQPLATFRSRDRALEEAIDLAETDAGELEVHYNDGSVATGRAKITGEGGLHCYPATLTGDPPPAGHQGPPKRTSHGRKHRRKKSAVSAAA